MDKTEQKLPKDCENKENEIMAKQLYSIRAKFYDKYLIKQDYDYMIEDLILGKIDELEAEVKALKAENERLSKVLEEEDRLHKSIIEIACVGSKEKKYQSVPERGVAMLYKEKEELKAENERLTTKDFLLREKIRILEEKPNPVSVEEMADIIYDNKFKGGVNTKQYILVVPEDIAQALFDRIYGKDKITKFNSTYYGYTSLDKPKVICDELPSGKGLLIKNPDFSEWKRGGGEAPDEWVAKHDKPEDNNLINLLDSVLPIVAIWNAETPAEKEWKENILKQIKGVIKLDKPKEYCKPIKTEKIKPIRIDNAMREYLQQSDPRKLMIWDKINEVIDHINKKGV
jgi:uncharacterized protein YdcH (DUF465 family)